MTDDRDRWWCTICFQDMGKPSFNRDTTLRQCPACGKRIPRPDPLKPQDAPQAPKVSP